MNRYCLTHLSDQALERETEQHLAREAGQAADLLARLAEIDARRLYAAQGYPSMYQYCVQRLRQCEDQACRRIQAARIARRFPALYPLLAGNRLHLSGVLLLGPWLTAANAAELLALAADRTKAELQQLLAERFPRPDLPERLAPLSAPARITALPGADLLLGSAAAPGETLDQVPAPAGTLPAAGPAEPTSELSSKTVASGELSSRTVAAGELPSKTIAPVQLSAPARITPGRSRLAPLSAGRWGFQCTLSEQAYRKFQHLRALLGHAIPSGDAAAVLEYALDAAIARLEKRKFSATERPRSARCQPSAHGRHIPAQVKRAVWARDGDQCTYVSDSGQRCTSRTRLELDHIEPVARGGQSTVGNLRLRCRAHNQLAAERTFGAGFMNEKRDQARRARAAEEAHASEEARARAMSEARARAAAVAEVIPWLRSLGLRPDEAQRAAAHCEGLADAPLETRLRHALASFGGPGKKLPLGPIRPT